jgi:hypothetical protein
MQRIKIYFSKQIHEAKKKRRKKDPKRKKNASHRKAFSFAVHMGHAYTYYQAQLEIVNAHIFMLAK